MAGQNKRTADQAGLGSMTKEGRKAVDTVLGIVSDDESDLERAMFARAFVSFNPQPFMTDKKLAKRRVTTGKEIRKLSKTSAARAQSSSSLSGSTLGKAETPLSFLAQHGTQMVDIFVGEEKQLFRIYKDLLCNKIEFFDKMFNGNFKEAAENTAVLPEDDPEAFDMLMCWATYGTIRPLMSEDFRKTLHLWILVEKLCLGNLQDQIMDMWRKNDKLMDKYYTAEEAQYIFEKTPSKSIPRQYAARMIRFQSLRPPAKNQEYSVDLRGDPIPLSNMNVGALSKLLVKNEDMLEDYLEVADRAQATQVNEMDPRATPFSCRFHHHPLSQMPCPSMRIGDASFRYLDVKV